MKTNRNSAVWLDIMSEIRKQGAFFTKSDRVACLRLIECVCTLTKVLSFTDRNEGYEEHCAIELLKYVACTCREFDIKISFPEVANDDYLHVVKRLSKGVITSGVVVLLLAYCLHASKKMYGDESTLFLLFKDNLQSSSNLDKPRGAKYETK